MLERDGKTAEALAATDKIVAASPEKKNPDAFWVKGHLHFERTEFVEAAAAYERERPRPIRSIRPLTTTMLSPSSAWENSKRHTTPLPGPLKSTRGAGRPASGWAFARLN